MLLGILRSTLNDVASEIKRSYDYMLSCYPGRRAADLVLVGGGASMPNLPPFMSEALGIKVRPASNFLSEKAGHLSYDSARQNRVEEVAQAIGSALNE